MDSWGIVDSTGDGMLVLDGDGTIRFANPAARRMFGRDIEGNSLGIPLAPNGTVEVGIHGPLGVEGFAEMRLTPLSWQGQSATLASLRDVTDREMARRELQDEKDFFAALMENLGALVVIMSPALVIERVNQACRRACGLRASQMVGRPLAEVFPDLEACIVKQSPPLECETDWSGCIVAWRLTAFGQHLVCTGYDISERRHAQRLLEQRNIELDEARRQAEGGSRAKTEFLAMMSHELRTPMSAVLGMLELLSESPLEDRQRDYVRLADTGARELLGVLDDILDISKIEAGHIKIRPLPFSLPRALARLVGVLAVEAQRAQCNLHLDCPADLPDLVVGDWGRLRQILLNLLGNALKFCDDDCGLRVRLVDGPQHTFHFSVWDTGDGIDPEDQERIFMPFIQVDGSLSRSHEGTGLGLAIAASLVKRMGGALTVESELGKGSTFSFQLTFPVAEKQRAEAEADSAHPTSVRILLVDDNPISRRVAVLMLENWGYSVESVDSGQQALERLGHRAHDVVLLDIQMPGMSGYDVLAKLRQTETATGQPPIPVVALTAHCVVGEQERALEAGMDGFLTKPVDRALLVSTFARLFPDSD